MFKLLSTSCCGLLLVCLCAEQAAAQASAFPVDLRIPIAPTPVMVNSVNHLLYEISIDNLSSQTFELAGLDVLSKENATAPLTSLRGTAIDKALFNPGAPPEKINTIVPGAHLLVYLDVALDPAAKIPADLHHHFLFSYKKPDGSVKELGLDGAPVAVNHGQVLILQPPLRGDAWVAYDLMNPDIDSHRRTLQAVNGKAFNNQRFAIDWVKLGADGLPFHDKADDNTNWYGFGAEVLAVANGVVVGIADGTPDNRPPASPPVSLESIAGNWIILDIGGGHFAAYAHLQLGSLHLKVGDRVRAGQVIAKLGNTGQSTGPHLHFQISNANNFTESEGLPFVFESFKSLGVLAEPDKMEAGTAAWHAQPATKPSVRRHEMPENFAVIAFPK